jgi:hypothetical protein
MVGLKVKNLVALPHPPTKQHSFVDRYRSIIEGVVSIHILTVEFEDISWGYTSFINI